jgi:signal transduction histidine kinase
MRRIVESALSALLVLLAISVIAGGWIVLADGLGFSIGVPTLWQGSDGPLLLAASAGVAAAAALALLAQRSPVIARALAVVALCAAVTVFDRWSAAPPALSALAVCVAILIIPALFTLATMARPRWHRLRAAAWMLALVAAVAILVFRDPFLDPLCAGLCGTSPFTISAQPGIVLLARWTVAALALAALAAGLVAALPHALKAPGPVGMAPSLSAVLLLAIVTVALGADAAWASGLVKTLPDLSLAWLLGLSVLGISHIIAALVTARRRAAVIALADELTSATSSRDDVGERLKIALRDPAVRIAYPRPDGSLVDAAGLPARGAAAGEGSTPVRHGDEIAAVIVHPVRIAGEELATAFGPAAGLALANARTRAVIRAALLELQALRLRLVDAGDDIRREIERNLHDGVQQTLLVLQYELALAAGEVSEPGRRELEDIREEVQRLTERTRDLGHGLFPMSLDDVGLDAALQRLADESLVPFEPDVQLPQRPPRSVERTAYLVARDAVVSASERALVRIRSEPDSLVIDIVGGPLTAVSRDRVDALGGHIRQEGAGMKVVLPCASS